MFSSPAVCYYCFGIYSSSLPGRLLDSTRKVRVSLPDQSSLLLQSLGFSEKSNQDQAPACERQHLVVSEASEKTIKSKSVFRNLNFTNTQPKFLFTNIEGNSTDKNSHTSCFNSVATHTHKPSVNLASGYSEVHNQPIIPISNYSNMLASLDSDFNVSSHIFSHLIRHHQPHTDLLEAAEYNMDAYDGKFFRPPTLSSSLPSNETSSMVLSQSNKHNFRFGILSRTYQFGAWLTKTASGEKMEVTKKDLNALAPNSF